MGSLRFERTNYRVTSDLTNKKDHLCIPAVPLVPAEPVSEWAPMTNMKKRDYNLPKWGRLPMYENVHFWRGLHKAGGGTIPMSPPPLSHSFATLGPVVVSHSPSPITTEMRALGP